MEKFDRFINEAAKDADDLDGYSIYVENDSDI